MQAYILSIFSLIFSAGFAYLAVIAKNVKDTALCSMIVLIFFGLAVILFITGITTKRGSQSSKTSTDHPLAEKKEE